MKWLNKKGFTLLELLVVVLIIGILAAIAMPQYKKVVEKSRLAEPLTILPALQKGIDMYLLTNPSTNVDATFLGDDIDVPLDIDITAGLDCDSVVEHCVSQHFSYSAGCNNGFCFIYAVPGTRGTSSSFPYSLYLSRISSTAWFKECDIYDQKRSYICDYLESQGFERVDC